MLWKMVKVKARSQGKWHLKVEGWQDLVEAPWKRLVWSSHGSCEDSVGGGDGEGLWAKGTS